MPLGKSGPASLVVGVLAGPGNTRCPLHSVVKHGGGTPSSTHTSSVAIPGHITTTVEMVSGWTICKSLAGVHSYPGKGKGSVPGGRTNVATFTSTAFHHLATGGRATYHSV